MIKYNHKQKSLIVYKIENRTRKKKSNFLTQWYDYTTSVGYILISKGTPKQSWTRFKMCHC